MLLSLNQSCQSRGWDTLISQGGEGVACLTLKDGRRRERGYPQWRTGLFLPKKRERDIRQAQAMDIMTGVTGRYLVMLAPMLLLLLLLFCWVEQSYHGHVTFIWGFGGRKKVRDRQERRLPRTHT